MDLIERFPESFQVNKHVTEVSPFWGCVWCILPKTHIAPENRPSQRKIQFPTVDFSGDMLVSGRLAATKDFYNKDGHQLGPLFQVSKQGGEGGKLLNRGGVGADDDDDDDDDDDFYP